MNSAFYIRSGDRYTASEHSVGPWGPSLQHGGPVAALLCSRMEQAAARSDMRVGHFALEFLRPVPVATLEVTTREERGGKKIALWSTSARVDGLEVARASAWLLQTSPGRNEEVRVEDLPLPPVPETATDTYFTSVPRFGYGDALEWRFSDGHFDAIGPASVWTRLRVDIVDGEPVVPSSRVLAMVDSANGISAELDVGAYIFVPVNLTVSMLRAPETEWVGMSAVTALASDGIGTTRARIFDRRGLVGEAVQTLYVERRA